MTNTTENDEGRLVTTYDARGNIEGVELATCGATRPGTLGYQRCTLPEGAHIHRSQDRVEWISYADGVNPKKGDTVEGVLAGRKANGDPLTRVVRRVITADPYPVNRHATILLDGHGAVAVLTRTIRTIETLDQSKVDLALGYRAEARHAAMIESTPRVTVALRDQIEAEDALNSTEFAAYELAIRTEREARS